MRHLLFVLAMLACCRPTTFVVDDTTVKVVSSQQRIPVYITADFTLQDATQVFLAVEAWNTALQGHVILDVVSTHATHTPGEDMDVLEHHGVLIMQVMSDCKFIPPQFPNAEAWTDKILGTKVWLVRDRIKSQYLMQVTMHELGHVLGAVDRETPGLMYYAVDPTFEWGCIDRQTALEVAEHHGLLLSQMSFCTERP